MLAATTAGLLVSTPGICGGASCDSCNGSTKSWQQDICIYISQYYLKAD